MVLGVLCLLTCLSWRGLLADDCPNVKLDLSKMCPLDADATEGWANCPAVKNATDCGYWKIVQVRSNDNGGHHAGYGMASRYSI